MRVKLLYNTPLWVCSQAIRTCWDSHDKSDTHQDVSGDIYGIGLSGEAEELCKHIPICGTKDKELIYRVGNKNKHKSTLEHLNYTFAIDGISRACLQELARHRHASLSVKSTRYTLKELKDEELDIVRKGKEISFNKDRADKYIVFTGTNLVDKCSMISLWNLQDRLRDGIANDQAKYCLPEAFKTSLVWTINARSLQNFLELRTSKAALWEIRDLAYEVFKMLPEDHKYLFKEFVNG